MAFEGGNQIIAIATNERISTTIIINRIVTAST
jgi:hypothetical protein